MILPTRIDDYNNLKEYGFSYTFVNLFDDVRYNTKVTINGRTLLMVCGYNQRTKMRWISLETLSGVVLLRRTPLVYNRQCELDSISKNYDMDYLVGIAPKDMNKTFEDGYDYLNWSKDFKLVFTGMPLTGRKRMERDILNTIVGE